MFWGRFRFPRCRTTTFDKLVCFMGVNTLYSTPSEKIISESLEQRAKVSEMAAESEAVPLLQTYLDGTTHFVNSETPTRRVAASASSPSHVERAFG